MSAGLRRVGDFARRRGAFVLGLAVVVLALTTVSLAAAGGTTTLRSLATGILPLGVGFSAIGLLLAARRAENPIGWMLGGAGVIFLVQAATDAYSDDVYSAHLHLPAAAYVANPTQWIFGPAMVLGFALPFLHFPDGRLLSPRWRWVSRTAWVGVLSMIATQAVQPGRLVNYPATNPLGVHLPSALVGAAEFGGLIAYVVTIAAAGIAVVKRFRAATADVRLQMRWFLYGVAISVLSFLAQIVELVLTNDVGFAVMLLVAVPVCMAIAILRYRLYDIDRIVSRTVGYAVVSACVLAPYLLLVVGVSDVAGSPIAVAALTLVAIATVRPLHRRIQGRVDRRFNRTRYNALRVVDEFSSRLRTEIDVPTVRADLVGAVQRTVEPSSISMWIAT